MPLRLAAGAVALVAWVGLAVQLHATLEWTGSVSTAVWALLRYFTIIANLAVAVVLTAVATGAPGCSPGLLGGVTLVVALVGAVYAVLLRGLIELSGADSLADTVLHVATPVLAPLFWLFFAPKGGLSYRDPWVWAVLPAIYFAYALARGAADGIYAYPFIDVSRLGWTQTLANGALIELGFLAAGFALVWLDGLLERERK